MHVKTLFTYVYIDFYIQLLLPFDEGTEQRKRACFCKVTFTYYFKYKKITFCVIL